MNLRDEIERRKQQLVGLAEAPVTEPPPSLVAS
jgi:hypothetical protein